MLCKGVREAEPSALDVPDVRQKLGGALALHVKKGQSRKERLVPYGELEWVLAVVDKWLELAGIDNKPIFRILRGLSRIAAWTTVRASNRVHCPSQLGPLRLLH